MRIISENLVNVADIVTELRRGKSLVFPTETCYGLGCDPTNQDAVDHIYEIKQRQKDKPLLVLVPDVHMICRYVDWTPRLDDLARKYWPGPLTIVADIARQGNLAQKVISDDNTVAFRVTSHPLAHALTSTLDAPLIATSANISAMQSPYSVEEVIEMFAHTSVQPDMVIDAGTLPYAVPSTIVRVTHDTIITLRQGAIVVE